MADGSVRKERKRTTSYNGEKNVRVLEIGPSSKDRCGWGMRGNWQICYRVGWTLTRRDASEIQIPFQSEAVSPSSSANEYSCVTIDSRGVLPKPPLRY